jgi:hypothetical protein
MSLKDQILAAQDLPTEQVLVPEWDVTVTVRGLSARERDDYFMSQTVIRDGQVVGQDTTNTTAKLLIRCIRGDDGEPVFGPEHVELLGQKSAAALDRLFKVASRLSGLAEEDKKDLGKDSAPTLNGVSASSSLVS